MLASIYSLIDELEQSIMFVIENKIFFAGSVNLSSFDHRPGTLTNVQLELQSVEKQFFFSFFLIWNLFYSTPNESSYSPWSLTQRPKDQKKKTIESIN